MTFDEISALVGLLGVALYLGSYAALQAGILRPEQQGYPLLNIAAALCVLFELQRNYNLPSVLIQLSWITISLFGLWRLRCERDYWRPEPAPFPDVRMMRSVCYVESLRETALGRSYRPIY